MKTKSSTQKQVTQRLTAIGKLTFTLRSWLLPMLLGLASTSTFAQSGSALNLDGIDDYVRVSSPFTAYSNAITVEAWINTTQSVWMGQSRANVDNWSNSNVWLWHIKGPGQGLDWLVSDGGTLRGISLNTLTSGWHHIATVASPTGLFIYVDGVLTVSSSTGISSTILNVSTSILDIGKDPRYSNVIPSGTDRYTQFSVDEVRIWNRALCDGEIEARKSCELPTGQTGLQCYYQFNQGTASSSNSSVTTMNDASGNSRNGTLFNLALSGSASNWIAPGGVTNGVACPTDASLDTDADGLANVCDLDDDNDGITDVSECNVSNFFWSNPPTVSGTTATGTINGIAYTYTSSSTVETTPAVYDHYRFPTSYGVPNANPTIKNTAVTNNTLTFASPMTNPVLVFASIGNSGRSVPINFGSPVEVLWSQNVTYTGTNPTQITGTEGYAIVRMTGTFTSITFNYTVAENWCNFAFGADFQTCGDTDNDGVSDYLDLDSDGDGCADAVEGGSNFLVSQTVGNKLSGSVGANGIPVLAGAGQTIGLSKTASSNCGCQSNIDRTLPVAIAKNITVTLDNSGNATVAASQVNDGSSDACGIASLALSKTNFNCSNLGTNNVTLTVTDVNGNVSTATAVVTVLQNPSLTATITSAGSGILCFGSAVTLNANTGTGFTYQWKLNGNNITGATNAVYIANTAGSYTVVVSQNGCSITSAAYVVSTDQTPPVAVCKNVNLKLNASGTASIVVPATTQSLLFEDWTGDNLGYYNNTPTLNWNVTGDIDRANFVSGIVGDEIDLSGFNNGIIESKQTFSFTPGTYTFSFQQIANSLGGNGVQVEIGTLLNQTFISALSITSESASFTVTANTTAKVKLTQVGPSDARGSFIGQIRLVRNVASTLAIENGSTDNCSIASITASKTEFDCSNIGANTVTLTVTDGYGNIGTCQAIVNIADTILPTLTCPNNISIQATSAAGAIVNYPTPVSTDVCGATVTLTSGLASGSVFPLGITTVTHTTTDPSGNSRTCSFTVNVTGTAPVIVSPGTIHVNTTAGLCSGVATYAATETVGAPASTITYSIPSGSTFTSGTTQVTATATNVIGSSSVTFDVVVNDNEPPIAACQNVTLALNAAGNASIVVPASTSTLLYEDWSGDISGYYSTTNPSYPSSTLNWNVTGDIDRADYVSGMPGIEIDLSGFANGAIETKQTFNFIPGSYTISFVQKANALSGNGVQVDIGTLFNQTFITSLNITSESATFTVTSNTNATLKLTQVGLSDPSGSFVGQIRLVRNVSSTLAIENGSTDNCSIASITASKTEFDCSNIGANTVTLTVTDNNNNVTTCQSTVTIVDNILPEFTSCPSNISVFATSPAGAVVTYDAPAATDVCGAVVSLTQGLVSGSTFPLGTTTVTHIAADPSGNVSTCSFTVTVVGLPPVIVSPGTIQINTTAGLCSGVASYTATETTGIPASTITYSIAPGSVFPVGTTQVTATATNAVGTSSTTFDVIVVDNEAPVAGSQTVTVYLDASGNGSTSAAAVNNGSADACGIASLTLSKTDFDCSNVGANTVTLTVTDVNGNVSTVDATVNVVDGIAPAAHAQNVTIHLDANGNGSTTAAAVNNGSTDACGIASLALSKTDFDCSNVGANTVTLTVTDVNGNVSTVDATVTVVDGIAPVAHSQNVTIHLDANGQGSTTAAAVNNGSTDACGIASLALSKTDFDCSNVGANTVTLTVTDVNGNVSNVDATVTVVDEIAPVTLCKSISVSISGGVATITPAEINNGSNDACGIASLSLSRTQFTCADIGTNSVVLTAVDVNGNVSQCTTTVIVLGTVPTCSISATPSNTTFTGGFTNRLYLGYGPQSMNLVVTGSGGSGFTYSWSGQYLSSTTGSTNVFTPTAAGSYTLTATVTNSMGCTSTCSITICVIDARDPNNANKVLLCHVPPGNPNNPQTLSISANAVPAHLSNHSGDALGSCSAVCGYSKNETSNAELITDETGVSDIELIVYPNPSNSSFTLQFESSINEMVEVKVLDMNGRIVYSETGMGANPKMVFGGEWSSGVYTVLVKQGNWNKAIKLTKLN